MAVLLLACSEAELLPNIPPPPPPVLNEAVKVKGLLPWEIFSKLNPNVETLRAKTEDSTIVSATVTLKSGQIEKYNFKNATELAQFEQKYGKYQLAIPPIVPPPPPVVIEFVFPSFTPDQVPADYKLFLNRYPQVKSIGWDRDKAIIFVAKSGRPEDNEIYYLNDPVSKTQAEKKYGELPKNPLKLVEWGMGKNPD